MKGKISEIFESIQGEGLYVGERQIFVRFYGCNLQCKFCDTKPRYFKEYLIEDLFKEIDSFKGHRCISFTGGEPLLQKDFLKEALLRSRQKNFRNYLETNGTMPTELEDVIEHVDIVAMDLKLPSSTGMADFWITHKIFLQVASKKDVFLKVVVCEDTLDTDIREAIKLIQDVHRSAVLILQPNSFQCSTQLKEKLNTFQLICNQEGIISCVIPQIHRMIGVR